MLLITMLIPVTVFTQSTERTIIDDLSQDQMKRILEVSDDFELHMKNGNVYGISDNTIIQFAFYEDVGGVQCYTYFNEEYDISCYTINKWNMEYNYVNAKKDDDGTYTTSTISLRGGVSITHVFHCLRTHIYVTNRFKERFGD